MKTKRIVVSSLAELHVNGEILFKCKNKWTRYFMGTLAILIGGLRTTEKASDWAGTIGKTIDARVGTDTSTPTNPSMDDLVSGIDIAPDSKTRRLIIDTGNRLFTAEFVFTWNAGTLPDVTVGELGVYFNLGDDSWSSPYLNPIIDGNLHDPWINSARRLASRIASADGAFDAFEFYGSIDPLTFKWRFQVAIT